MIWILFLSLIALAVVAYIFEKRDILSPWTISCVMFAISVFFALMNRRRWGYELSPLVVIAILSGLLAFGAGCVLVYAVAERSASVPRAGVRENSVSAVPPGALKKTAPARREPVDIPGTAIFITVAAMLFVFAYIFIATYRYSLTVGNDEGVRGMIRYTREAIVLPGHKTLGRVAGHLNLLSECVRIVFIFFFLYNCILCKFRAKWLLYLLPPLVDVFTQILGTGRTFAIRIAAMTLLTAFVMYNTRYGWKRSVTLRVVGFGAAALGLFFVAFTLMGLLTGKTGVRSVWDTISIYTGLSIPSFDVYLNTPRQESSLFGGETLYGIYNILRTLGADLPETVRHLEFAHFGDYAGNVYTSLRRYVNDYGFAGMIVIQFLLGALSAAFYRYIKKAQNPGFPLIIYSYLFYILVMQGIDELLFSSLAGTTGIYTLLYLVVIYITFRYLSYSRQHVTRRRFAGEKARA